MQRDVLELLKRIANALALQFGTNCEVVIHDLTGDDPENTIACIENGHVSKRDAKAGPSRIVLDAMREGRRDLPDHYNYLTKTNDGRILRSSSVYIKDESGKATGIFCINYDLTDLMMAQSVINNFVQRGGPGKEPERIPTNVNELLDDLLEKKRAAGRQAGGHDEQGRQGAGHRLPKRGGSIAHHQERRQDRQIFRHQQIQPVRLSGQQLGRQMKTPHTPYLANQTGGQNRGF